MSDTLQPILREQVDTPAVPSDEPQTVAIGVQFTKAREAAGLSMEDVAARLKLSVAFIEALETEAYEKFKAAAFIKGHVRSYCELLGLPADVFISALPADAVAAPPAKPVLVYKPAVSPREKRSQRRWMILLAVGVFVAFFVGWIAKLPQQEVALTPAQVAQAQLLQDVDLPMNTTQTPEP